MNKGLAVLKRYKFPLFWLCYAENVGLQIEAI